MEENIINHINASVSSLRDEFLNLKDIVIKRLQDENTRLQSKCKSLEDKVTSLEENLNSLDQYGRRNNTVLSGIPECVADNALEATVASILADIDVDVGSNALEACHRFGKPERTTKSRKTIVRFTNRKYCKKALLNRKKLANLDNEKHQLGSNNKIFISENLSRMNENIAFETRKLKEGAPFMATLQGMLWFISSSVSMIEPLKSFIKIISVSMFWIMKRKRKIYFMMCHRK